MRSRSTRESGGGSSSANEAADVKRTAIMQPYFFPYLGYFSLIKHTDLFVLFDTVQYIHHGWIERNRILKQRDGCISAYRGSSTTVIR